MRWVRDDRPVDGGDRHEEGPRWVPLRVSTSSIAFEGQAGIEPFG